MLVVPGHTHRAGAAVSFTTSLGCIMPYDEDSRELRSQVSVGRPTKDDDLGGGIAEVMRGFMPYTAI